MIVQALKFKWSLYRHEYRNPIKSDFYELVSSPDRNALQAHESLEQLLQSLDSSVECLLSQKGCSLTMNVLLEWKYTFHSWTKNLKQLFLTYFHS